MTDVSQFVSEDSREPIERLRRRQLWDIADAYDIKYPAQAPKTAMIDILKGHGVDVTKPVAGIQWQRVTGTDSEGRQNTELYPVAEEHASKRNGVNAELVMTQRLEQQKKEDEAKQKKLEAENDELKSIVARMQERLEALEKSNGHVSESPAHVSEPTTNEIPTNYFQLVKYAQEKGLPVTRKMKKAEIMALLNG